MKDCGQCKVHYDDSMSTVVWFRTSGMIACSVVLKSIADKVSTSIKLRIAHVCTLQAVTETLTKSTINIKTSCLKADGPSHSSRRRTA